MRLNTTPPPLSGSAHETHLSIGPSSLMRLPLSGQAPFGEQLRSWRQYRRLSQLGLAEEASISSRHVSFLETGRTNPSREMVLRLCERLAIPLRERNGLLVAAGYAPMYRESALNDPALASAKRAVERVLQGHAPSPALALDRYWNVVASNEAAQALLTAHVSAQLLTPPFNVLHLSLHPEGLAPRIINLTQWRTHLLERLHQQIQASGDSTLMALRTQLLQYPASPEKDALFLDGEMLGIVMPLRFQSIWGTLSFISTTTLFGTPVDITLQELAVESFFPADEQTASILRKLDNPADQNA